MKPNSGAAIYEKYSGKNLTEKTKIDYDMKPNSRLQSDSNFNINLIPKYKTKRGEGFCKQCKNTIEHGTKYASVVYNDGFMERGYGSFHIQCWNELNK